MNSENSSTVKIKFERVQFGIESPEHGPFPFVQLTYEALRIGPDGDFFAHYDGEFWTIDNDPQANQYSDVIIFAGDSDGKATS